VRIPKRPTREARFLETFAKERAEFETAVSGLNRDQRKDRDDLLRARAANGRIAIWTRWLGVPSWTPRQAAFLIAGLNPKEGLLGSARHSGAARKLILGVIEQVKALAEEHLKPVKRLRSFELRRYRPLELLRLALGPPALGYSIDLDALAQQLAALRPAPREPPVRAKRNVALERAQIVVAVAHMLIAEGVGYEQDGNLYLHLKSREFLNEIRARRRDTHLFDRYDWKTLQRARLTRTGGSPLPRVVLEDGRPKGA
jgi:hypothetical protein